jgi:cation transporter-like permease
MKKATLTLFAALFPAFAFGQVTQPTDFRGVVELILSFLQLITAAAWVVLLIAFIYNVIKFLTNFDDERAREEGKRSMVFTLVAGVCLFVVWGVIALLSNSFFGSSRFGIPLLTPPA